MSLPNDGIRVTPGSGATVATHNVVSGTAEYQVNMLADAVGHVLGTKPRYGLSIPPLDASVANNWLWEFFNAPSSGLTVSIHGVYPIPTLRQARTGALAAQFDFYRSTAVSSGGSFGAFEASASTMTANFFRFDTNDPSLSSHVSCKTEMTSITTGTRLFDFNVATEEAATSMGYIAQDINVLPGGHRAEMKPFVLRVGTGLVARQGPIASVGSVGWFVDFTTDP